jgi:chorismate dehydratase
MLVFSSNSLLKIGLPRYLNTLPLLHFLKVEGVADLYLLTPSEINSALQNKELQAGLASSLFYAKNFKDFLILPDLSISTVGKVRSVILYHKVPLPELNQCPLGITPETETSFGLLRIILEEFFHIKPEYLILKKKIIQGALKEELFKLSGYLAIGDEALLLEREEVFPFSTDLAEIWLKKTHLPFVFALFIARKDLLDTEREKLKIFLSALYLSRAKGLSALQEIVETSHLPLNKDFALKYLHHLEFDFSGLKQRAFLHFCKLLYKKGIIKEVPKLYFFEL